MLNMKTASIRELQHHLSRIMLYIDHGEEVLITRRNKVVAKLIPSPSYPKSIDWPDFLKRSKSIIGISKGKTPGEIIINDRKERF